MNSDRASLARHRPRRTVSYEGAVGALTVGLVLVTMPLVGWSGPTWAVALVYLVGLAGIGLHLARPAHRYPDLLAFLYPMAWVTSVVLLTGARASPYQLVFVLVVLLLATYRRRALFLLGAILTGVVGLAIVALPTPGEPEEFVIIAVAVAVLLVAGGVINTVVASLHDARLQLQSVQAAMDELAEPVVMYDLTADRFVYLNAAAANLVGQEVEGLVGRPSVVAGELVHRLREAGVARLLEEPSAMPVREAIVWPAPNGEERHLDVTYQLVRDDDREFVVAVAHDVSAWRRALLAERQAVERLQDVDGMKNAFVAAVSHELRTPLTVVKGMASTLADHRDQLSAKQISDLARRIDVHAGRLAVLLDDLLDVDRMTRGLLEPKRQQVDPHDVVEAVIASREMEAMVELRARSRSAEVDPSMLARIADNLLTNAAKYAPGPIDVAVDPLPGAGVHLVVNDRGPGVPDTAKATIFEPFRRLDPNHPSPGTGIGLSLVSRFASLHGGRAWVEDREGGGARVHVLLPGPPVDDAHASVPSESHAGESGSAPDAPHDGIRLD